MKKILTASLITLAMVMTGCASKPEPMPMDVNPSEALQFARAMNMRAITDEGDNYLIYNELTSDYNVAPYSQPIKAGETGSARKTSGALGDVAAGFITHTTFIPVLSVLTSKRPASSPSGFSRVGSWSGSDDGMKIVEIVKSELPKMDGWNENPKCPQHGSNVGVMGKHTAADGSLITLDAASLPRPPALEASANVVLYGFNACFFDLGNRKSNQEKFRQMSERLGSKMALFIQGSQEHPPYVYHNGRVLEFKK